jgi:hypothetical protein
MSDEVMHLDFPFGDFLPSAEDNYKYLIINTFPSISRSWEESEAY